MRNRTLLTALVTLLACGGPAADEGSPNTTPSPSTSGGGEAAAEAAPSAFADASRAFGIDLYRQLAVAEGNLAISPASVSTALAMTYGGAEGETAAQLREALRFGEASDSAIHASAGELLARWNAERDDYELSVANRLFVLERYPLAAEFVALTGDTYLAPIEGVDFLNAHEPARARINGWVSEQTHERIPEVLPSGSVNPETRLVLTNAVYFHGAWETEFPEAGTVDEPFFLDAERSVEVPMMNTETQYTHAEDAEVHAVELPYRGGDLAMLIVVPKERDGLAALEGSLSQERLDGWVASLSPTRVELAMPRFRIAGPAIRLKAPLEEMGMVRAFTPDAELTSMVDSAQVSEPLFIDDVYHRTFVEVNEEGTEAAAATAVVVRTRSARPRPRSTEVRADRPFLFFLRDRQSGAVLFMGRVADPR